MSKVFDFYHQHRRRITRFFVPTILVLVVVLALGVWSFAQFHLHPTRSNGFTCTRSHIYLPYRLSFRGCKTVTGTITSIKAEPDGDYHALMRLDVQYMPLLALQNYRKKGGTLVIEDVCHFSHSDEVAKEACENYQSPFPDLVVGQRYEITGNYVIDRLHGNWAEIHGLSEVKPVP